MCYNKDTLRTKDNSNVSAKQNLSTRFPVSFSRHTGTGLNLAAMPQMQHTYRSVDLELETPSERES